MKKKISRSPIPVPVVGAASGRPIRRRRRVAAASGHRRGLVRPPRHPPARPHARPIAGVGRPARACGRGRRRIRQICHPCALAGNPGVHRRRRPCHVGPDPRAGALHRAEQSAAFQSPAGVAGARFGDDRRVGRFDRRAHASIGSLPATETSSRRVRSRPRASSARGSARSCCRRSGGPNRPLSAQPGIRPIVGGDDRPVPIDGGTADGI